MVSTRGKHLIVDIWEADGELLNNVSKLEEVLLGAARESEATVLNSFFHKFDPAGVTGVLTISESHIAIHTWPEEGYASLDIYTCGDRCFPGRAIDYIFKALDVQTNNAIELLRGNSKLKIVESEV